MALVFDVYVIVNNPVPPGGAQDKSKVLVATKDTYEEAVEVRDAFNNVLNDMFEHFKRQPMPRGWAPFAAGTVLSPREQP